VAKKSLHSPLPSFKKTPKENNRPIGENSPNLVTLRGTKSGMIRGRRKKNNCVVGRVTRFAQLAIFYFGRCYRNYRSSPHFCATFFLGIGHVLIFPKGGWATFWAIFSQTHPVTLLVGHQLSSIIVSVEVQRARMQCCI
jgi:hypothetical protein